ncbi:AAA family ATPase [Frankia sp. Mgl5]|nr:AAA family ATPase [Frankia sp. Mgl5]
MGELVERNEQLTCLEAALSDCLEARGGVAVLEGPATTGRTDLLRALSERAGSAGIRVLNAACSREERSLPLGVMTQLTRGLQLPTALTERIARISEAELAATSLGGATNPLAPFLIWTIDALSTLLLDLAEQQPLLVAVDDVGHADLLSLHCLLHLVRRIPSTAALLVLTDDGQPWSWQSPPLVGLLRQPHAAHVRVGPLSRAGIEIFVTQTMGVDAAVELTPAFQAASGGNPALLTALVKDHWAHGGPTAQGYGRTLVTYLYRAGAETARVVHALAVLGPEGTAHDLATMADCGVNEVRRVIEPMTAAGLLADGWFRHEIMYQAVLDDISDPVRVELHRRAAALSRDRGARAATVACHLVAADQTTAPWGIRFLLDAADQALVDDDHDRAVECLRLAHRSTADERRRSAVLARLTRVEWWTNPSSAARNLSGLLSAAGADMLNRDDQLELIRQLVWDGRLSDVPDLLGRRYAASRGDGDGEPRHIEVWLTVVAPLLGRRSGTRRVPAEAVADAGDPWLRSVAELASLLNRGRLATAVPMAEQVLADARIGRRTSWLDEAVLLALLVLVYAEQLTTAINWCKEMISTASGTPRAMALAVMSEALVRQGDLAAGADHAHAALAQLTPGAWGAAVGLPLGALIMATTRMGDYETASAHVARAIPEAMFQTRYGLHYLHSRAYYQLATGHHHAALGDFLACGELMRGWGLDLAGLVPWRVGAAEAWLRLGNSDQARVLIRDQLPRAGAEAGRARALSLRLLAATSPPNRRTPLLTEALDILEMCGDRFEQARVLGDLSRTYDTLGQKRRARPLFRQAMHVANLCQARPLSRELLSEWGEEVVEPGPAQDNGPARESLTEAERRVASLAVMGYTNREIATKLYVTASTVEQHLTKVYRKLDVKRRQDLPVDLRAELSRTRG